MRKRDIERLRPVGSGDAVLDAIARIRDEAATVLLTDADAPHAIVGHLVQYCRALCARMTTQLRRLIATMSVPVSKYNGRPNLMREREDLEHVSTSRTAIGRAALVSLRTRIDRLGYDIGGASLSELQYSFAETRTVLDRLADETARSLDLFFHCFENLDYGHADRYLLSRRKVVVKTLLSEAERDAAAGKLRDALGALALASSGLDVPQMESPGRASGITMAADPERVFTVLRSSTSISMPLMSEFEDQRMVLDIETADGNTRPLELPIIGGVRPMLKSADLSDVLEDGGLWIDKDRPAETSFQFKAEGWNMTITQVVLGTLSATGELESVGDPKLSFKQNGIGIGDVVVCMQAQPEVVYWTAYIVGFVDEYTAVLKSADDGQQPFYGLVTFRVYHDNHIEASVNNKEEVRVALRLPVDLGELVYDYDNDIRPALLSLGELDVDHPDGSESVSVRTIKFGRLASISFATSKLVNVVLGLDESFSIGEDGTDRLVLQFEDGEPESHILFDAETERVKKTPGEIASEIARLFVNTVSSAEVNGNQIVIYGPLVDGRLSVGGSEDEPSGLDRILRLSRERTGVGVTVRSLNAAWDSAVSAFRDAYGSRFNLVLSQDKDGYLVITVDTARAVTTHDDGARILGLEPKRYVGQTQHVRVLGKVRRGDVLDAGPTFTEKVGFYWVLSEPISVDSLSGSSKNVGVASYDEIAGSKRPEVERVLAFTDGIPDDRWRYWASQLNGTDRSETIAELKGIVSDVATVSQLLASYKSPTIPPVDSLFSEIDRYSLDRGRWFLMGLMLGRFFFSEAEELSTLGLAVSTAAKLSAYVSADEEG